jgi:serine/threonine protein kinase
MDLAAGVPVAGQLRCAFVPGLAGGCERRAGLLTGGLVSGEVPGDARGLLAGVAGVAVGSRVAGYLLEEQVGEGGMAVVFRARDERLDRVVAVKVLAPALAGNAGGGGGG